MVQKCTIFKESVEKSLLYDRFEPVIFQCQQKIVICQTRTWGHSISTLFKAGDGVNTLILSTDGNYCLNGGADGRVELRDAWTLDLLHTFPKCDTGKGLKFTFCSRAPPRFVVHE